MTRSRLTQILSALCLMLVSAVAQAGEPTVEAASVERHGMAWKVTVTLRHGDVDWDHFADAWRVEDRFGRVLDVRYLMHPRVDEQPFTRSLTNVQIPDGTRVVYIRASCTEHGWNKEAVPVQITLTGS